MPARQRAVVRVALLSLAAAILLLGAVLAVVFCCRAVTAGTSAPAAPHVHQLARASAAR